MGPSDYFEIGAVDARTTLQQVQDRLTHFEETGEILFPSLSASMFQNGRWRTPFKTRSLTKVSEVGQRIVALLQILNEGKLRKTNIRDIWYIALGAPYFQYPEGSSTNPYKNQLCGNDIPLLEAILGTDRETFGIQAGERGFLLGADEWHLYTQQRGTFYLNVRPMLLPDIGSPQTHLTSEVEKIMVLEKEAFVPHLVPEHSYGYDFNFLRIINTMIVTSKGYEGKYLKLFVKHQADRGRRILSFHDADWDGFAMSFILRHHSKASSHLADNMRVEPVELGLFATVCKKLGLVPEPIKKNQLQRMEYVKDMARYTEAPQWIQEEIDLVAGEQKRYELQALSGIHEKAAQCYIIELFRQRNIPLKDLPDKKEAKKKLLREFAVRTIKGHLQQEIELKLEELIEKIREEVNAAIEEQVDMDALIEEAVENIDPLHHSTFIEDVLETHLADLHSRRLLNSNDGLTNALQERAGTIEVTCDLEYDLEKPLTEMVSDVLVSAERTMNTLEEVEPQDPYDRAIAFLGLPQEVCVKFRYAFQDKFGDDSDE